MSETDPAPIKVDIWSDVTCVWCHIGKRKFEIGRDQFTIGSGTAVEVEYHSYQLDQNPPVEYGGRYAEFLTEVMNLPARHVRECFAMIDQIGDDVGLAFAWDKLQPAHTLLAHQAIHFAKTRGKQTEMNDRLLAAYFHDGRDVGSLDELIEMAADVGLDVDGMRDALAREEFLPAVRADIARASLLGITSVPFFVVDGKYGVAGAQSSGVFKKALERAAGERR